MKNWLYAFLAIFISALIGFLLIVIENFIYRGFLYVFSGFGGEFQNVFFFINLLVMFGDPILIGYIASRISKKYFEICGIVAAIIVVMLALNIFNIQTGIAGILIGIAYVLPKFVHFIVPDSVLGGYVDATPFTFLIFIVGAFLGSKIRNFKAQTDHSK